MPVTVPLGGNYSENVQRMHQKLTGFLAGMSSDLQFAGSAAAEAIVRTTLAGIGEADQPFAPYSDSYKQVIDAVGGKPQGTVNLRGLFYHEGQQRKRFRSEKSRQREREGRRSFIGVAFVAGGKDKTLKRLRVFQARTGITRPARGVTDPNSEMSLDLIKVHATDTTLRLTYEPRSQSYMVDHQEGRGKQPKRTWFTMNKAAVWSGFMNALKRAIAARAKAFNEAGNTSGPQHPASFNPAGGFWVD